MIYLIHFDRPYKHACHYLGFVESNLDERIARHKAGHGAKLLKIVTDAGIPWNVVRVWPDGTRDQERKLKARSSTRLCPVCLTAKALAAKMQPVYPIAYTFSNLNSITHHATLDY